VINNKTVLAVIPARIGSKRLPRKNILPLSGKPLVGWTISAAKDCKYIDKIFVSTDDQEIADKSKQFGVDIPFLRSRELSVDSATSMDVVLNVLRELEGLGDYYDYIVLLQPTSPLRTAEHITMAIEQLIKKNQDAVISVCQAEHHPLWCNRLPDDGSMHNFLRSDLHNKRSQDLSNYYRLNGAIYICDVNKLKAEKTFLLSNKCSAFIMSQESSVDIDTKIDFQYAKILLENLSSNG
jgi:CMP-N,N'-diacetyllegionaminic acid synthase